MQLYCQSCQAAFAGTTHCPKCGGRLLSPQESFVTGKKAKAPPPDRVPPTFIARLVIGLSVAGMLAIAFTDFSTFLTVRSGFPIDLKAFGVRLFAVLGGGLIAGAGCRQGYQVGIVVGAIAAAALTGWDAYLAGQVESLVPLAIACAYPVIGCLAAATGSFIWPADADLPEPTRLSSHGSSIARLAAEDAARRQERPTNWVRIMLGTLIIVAGIAASDSIRFAIMKGSGGIMNTGGLNRAALRGLQVASITTILGGILAGMSTGAGLRHGFFAAVLSLGCLGIMANTRPNGLFPAFEGFLIFFDLAIEPFLSPRVGLTISLAILGFVVLGGWLGGQLFPPLAPRRYWKRSLQRGA
jgi:hypothetical protein